MLEVKPVIRTEMAIELYRSEKISLSRAAQRHNSLAFDIFFVSIVPLCFEPHL